MNEQNEEIKIELSPEVAQGKYANLAIIAHGPNEFFIDMIMMAPNAPQAKVQSRIIMTPENAKQLLFALQANVQKFESTFGEIKLRQPINNDEKITFMGPNGQA